MKAGPIARLLFGTLPARLILSVALVHPPLMTLFIVDVTRRQHAFSRTRSLKPSQ
jgi:hypothetical protein